ncbi:MAG: tyrosine-protein phosphatase [Gammaproteobacteria bacterium]|nr:tyrosine-protein phosphatase [Gammaproteobacteria bacterium]MBU1722569.1 tyrosine-protein phosphatase [Gammaproteobacteria bacterium]MBU2004470.1 tyrosine-protein phosphatase [Gammaproteobacteria bacterium]
MQKIILLLFLLLPSAVFAVQPERPADWAKPVAAHHLQNFWQVSPLLYRSAQPYVDGFRELPKLGIGEVLDLRLYHLDVPAEDIPLTLHRAPLFASSINEEKVISALQVIANAKRPVLVHCLHGSDRTGLVVAMYRVVCQGWSKQQAIAEMVGGGYGYHSVFENIPDFIEKVDVEAARQEVHGAACPAAGN